MIAETTYRKRKVSSGAELGALPPTPDSILPGNETKMVGSLGLCVAELTERVKEVLFADVCG